MMTPTYGQHDTSFRAAGGEAGVRRLVDAFYDRMSSDQRYAQILSWHPDDLELSRDKLTCFLCGWLGGPRHYQERYGGINIPKVHQHLAISFKQRDLWLLCMTDAVAAQDYAASFKRYLIEQLAIPAEAIRRRCTADMAVPPDPPQDRHG